MTPRQRQEMTRLETRVRVLEQRNRELSGQNISKASVDRLIWLVHEIEAKPKTDRFVRVPLSASDGKLLRTLANALSPVPPRSASTM